MHNKNLSWVILAGGQASRMGGNDKGLIELNGLPLIEISYHALSKQVENLYINANRNLDQYKVYTDVIQDDLKGYQGPLAGIQSCLAALNTEWVGFSPCDSPNIPNDLVERLTACIQEDIDIIVAHDGKHPQPVFSLWNKRALSSLNLFLSNGNRKMKLLLNENRTKYVDFSDIPKTFINLNTPKELEEFGHK